MLGGCSSEQQTDDQTGAGGQAEEAADTTRMEAAEPDTVMQDSMTEEAVPDSM
jgi:hypothetical protein